MQITLKAARMNANLTRKEAAKRIGVIVDTIGNWERARSFPNALQISKIEEVYRIRYDNLIFCREIRFKRFREEGKENHLKSKKVVFSDALN